MASICGIAQDASKTPARTRTSIGLVLEGGGALGLAHIGVIQWLEEHRIPVNYVAGTSMGGLVAGVYATGRSAAEVREVVETINWDEVLRGQTPFQDLSFRRKQDAHDYAPKLSARSKAQDLRRWGLKLAERGGKNGKKRAVVATARKLAVLLHRLWVSGEAYEPLRNSRQVLLPAAA